MFTDRIIDGGLHIRISPADVHIGENDFHHQLEAFGLSQGTRQLCVRHQHHRNLRRYFRASAVCSYQKVQATSASHHLLSAGCSAYFKRRRYFMVEAGPGGRLEDVFAVRILHDWAVRLATLDGVPSYHSAVSELEKLVLCPQTLAVLHFHRVWSSDTAHRYIVPRRYEKYSAKREAEPKFPVRERSGCHLSVSAGDVFFGDCRLPDSPPALQATLREVFDIVEGSGIAGLGDHHDSGQFHFEHRPQRLGSQLHDQQCTTSSVLVV